jgi:hypothetical protein
MRSIRRLAACCGLLLALFALAAPALAVGVSHRSAAVGVRSSAAPALLAGDAAGADPAAVDPAGRPVAAARVERDTPMGTGLIGLLAIIATVCVVGVSVGAIRAIIGQGTSPTELA